MNDRSSGTSPQADGRTSGPVERQGTARWFELAGTQMVETARRIGLPPDLTVSLLERYVDGTELSPGLVQGIRFDVVDGRASYRIGARPDETADIVVEVTAAAARALNLVPSADPDYGRLRESFATDGELAVSGDASALAELLDVVHDPIVDRTI